MNLPEVLLHPSLIPLWVLLSAVLLDLVWQVPEASHPLTLWRYLCAQMARKVRPSTKHGVSQHHISGTLGAFSLLLPFLLVLIFFLQLVEFRWFFDALLLWLMLDFGRIFRQYRQVKNSLAKEQKLLARERLSQLVTRDCAALSPLGIAKAAMESLLLRFAYQCCAVIFWYCTLGIEVAVAYRLLLSMSWQWHFRQPGFHHFARPLRALVGWFKLPGLVLAAFTVALTTSPMGAWQGLNRARKVAVPCFYLAVCGGGLGIQLAGPAIYAGNKIRSSRVGGLRQAKFSDMTYTIRGVARSYALFIAFTSLVVILLHQ